MKRNLISSLICGITLSTPYAFAQGTTTHAPPAAGTITHPAHHVPATETTTTTTQTTTHHAPAAITAPAPCPPGKCEGMWMHHRKHEAQFLTKALHLTPAQTKAMRPILEQRYASLKALHENPSMSVDQRKKEAKKIFKESHDKLIAVLTPEQKKTMHEIRKHHMHKEESASNCSDPHCSNSVCPSTSQIPDNTILKSSSSQ